VRPEDYSSFPKENPGLRRREGKCGGPTGEGVPLYMPFSRRNERAEDYWEKQG